MTPAAKAQWVKTLAHEVGFDLVGITRAGPVGREAYYRGWLAAGNAGSMTYLARNVRLRLNPSALLPGARSVICTAVNYRRADGYARPEKRHAASAGEPVGRVAQYARGRDYHVVLRRMLETLQTRIAEGLDPPFESRVYVDTGPLLERELAAAAGLGWIGRNTCLLHPQLGSYLLLGELVTTLELEPDAPLLDQCARCRRCLDACPTGALTAPYQMNATRCISYLTIEHRGAVPEQLADRMSDWVYGCDICQQVCPYNARAPHSSHPEIGGESIPPTLPLDELLALRSGDYRRLTRDTAARRARRQMWQRNAALATANVGRATPRGRAALRASATAEDVGLRAAAQRALAHLSV
jgi:epoxyqueuosine reductase